MDTFVNYYDRRFTQSEFEARRCRHVGCNFVTVAVSQWKTSLATHSTNGHREHRRFVHTGKIECPECERLFGTQSQSPPRSTAPINTESPISAVLTSPTNPATMNSAASPIEEHEDDAAQSEPPAPVPALQALEEVTSVGVKRGREKADDVDVDEVERPAKKTPVLATLQPVKLLINELANEQDATRFTTLLTCVEQIIGTCNAAEQEDILPVFASLHKAWTKSLKRFPSNRTIFGLILGSEERMTSSSHHKFAPTLDMQMNLIEAIASATIPNNSTDVWRVLQSLLSARFALIYLPQRDLAFYQVYRACFNCSAGHALAEQFLERLLARENSHTDLQQIDGHDLIRMATLALAVPRLSGRPVLRCAREVAELVFEDPIERPITIGSPAANAKNVLKFCNAVRDIMLRTSPSIEGVRLGVETLQLAEQFLVNPTGEAPAAEEEAPNGNETENAQDGAAQGSAAGADGVAAAGQSASKRGTLTVKRKSKATAGAALADEANAVVPMVE